MRFLKNISLGALIIFISTLAVAEFRLFEVTIDDFLWASYRCLHVLFSFLFINSVRVFSEKKALTHKKSIVVMLIATILFCSLMVIINHYVRDVVFFDSYYMSVFTVIIFPIVFFLMSVYDIKKASRTI
ncbi:MAG: hypothetical protein ED557_11955 [Balneola sp.]|nr:MAG: hypothetical protein ED557_11955 [Balneola sp.]